MADGPRKPPASLAAWSDSSSAPPLTPELLDRAMAAILVRRDRPVYVAHSDAEAEQLARMFGAENVYRGMTLEDLRDSATGVDSP